MITKKCFFDAERKAFKFETLDSHEPTKILFDPRTMSLVYNFVLEQGDTPQKDYPILRDRDAVEELKTNMIAVLEDHIKAFKKEIKKIRSSPIIGL